ncbi:hypothetical protein DY000_02016659 [Brassica cretica]|uniref:Uncharacterized protein n=1 Tax=Brassica cretica TaxID=69181 RepID=A0ABQ7D0V5_BRACR|nr:hypothetical protein DY000_02016659 [Brassica cretica]
MRVTSHFPRIATTSGYVSSHPFGFPINQKGWGTNVGPNIGQLSNWARMAWPTQPREEPNFDEAGRRPIQGNGDRGMVASVTGAARYKKRSTHKGKGTLKTLERATPILRPYVVGHIKLVNGQILTEHLILDEVEIATTRRLLVHVQSHDEPVVKLYLWDQAGTEFCKKFKSYEKTPTVLLVTTANTKHLGDYDIQPTIDYFSWLGSNPEIAKQVNAEVVTKPETLTIGKYSPTSSRNLQSYAFPAIGFSFFHNGYRAKISVYDNSDQAVFVLLGDAGRELTGKYKSKLVSSYFQANQNQGVNHEVLVPAVGIHTVYNDL